MVDTMRQEQSVNNTNYPTRNVSARTAPVARSLTTEARVTKARGFTLVELMVSMVVGVLIVGGAFSLHSTSRKTQVANEAQMDMVADARFAIETISHDLRSAGMWGGTSRSGLIDCKSTQAPCTSTSAGDTPPSGLSGDCAVGWYYDLTLPVFASDGDVTGNPYSATCIPASEGYVGGTDILEIKYADSNPPVQLLPSRAYIRSNVRNGRIFIGTVPPVLEALDSSAMTANFALSAHAYYISDYTDSPGDGIPSLRRVSLSSGGLQNQLMASGVSDLQVQFGEDVNGDLVIDRYVNPDQVSDWTEVYAAKIWLMMRTDSEMDGVDTEKDFTMAGVTATYGGQDDFRYFMVSSVASLRNLQNANNN